MSEFDDLRSPPFGLSQAQRRSRLGPILRSMTAHHATQCEAYRSIADVMFPRWAHAQSLEDLPYVPIRVFKQVAMKSVEDQEVVKTITSSGTTGDPSKVYVDRETAARQTRALNSIMGHVLGSSRRPMLVIDGDHVLADRANRTARAAGVVGLMALGRHHTFALDPDMEPRIDRIAEFLRRFHGEPLLVFGFTFMVWQYLACALRGSGLDLSQATIVHSGGWKQMEAERVDNETFKDVLRKEFGARHVVNFYGMAEQVGSVFIEAEDGLLHPSSFSEVIIRDPLTLAPAGPGETGLIQVISTVPLSYPGHSILTEDLGRVESIDDLSHGLGGKALRVIGRLPKSELRGCSDTFTAGARATR